jgi:tRNA(adenine34) deaminase
MDASLDKKLMQRALAEARAALAHEDVPIGAIAVDRGTGAVVGRGHNQRELLQDPTAHAEMLALTAAAAHYRSWRLVDVVLYVTLEPCPMCAGAIVLARIPRLVYGARDPKAGAHVSVMRLFDEPALNHHVTVEGGLLAEESGELLREFFAAVRRAKGKSNNDLTE